MSLKKDIIEAEFRTTGANKLQSEIGSTEGNIKRLNNENERLRVSKTKLEAQGKKNTKAWKQLNDQIKKNTVTVQDEKKKLTELNSQLKITDMSAKQLTKRKRELAREINNTSEAANPARWKKLNKEYEETSKQLGKVRAGSQKTGKTLSILKSLLPVVGVAALAAGVKKLALELWNLTKIVQGDAVRSSTVFGDQLGYVKEQSKKLARQMGLTNREFVAAAAGTADLLIPLDFNRKMAANMSVELQSLAGALDEWTGGQLGAKEVSDILTKAMLGENEQLKRLGIAIRKDTDEFRDLVKQKIAATGATKVQAEAMATLELIQKKSADAQAAYNMEGNKLLRFQKEASVRIKNMKEGFISLFEVPVSEKLKLEREEVSKLSAQLLDSNTSYEDRVKILGKLEKINSGMVKGLNAEKIEYSQLSKNLREYNEELAKRIVLANLQEEEEKALTNAAKQLEKLTRAQEDLQKFLLEGGYGEYLTMYDSWEERAQAVSTHLEDIIKKQKEANKTGYKATNAAELISGVGDTRTQAQKDIKLLSYLTDTLNTATNKYDKKLDKKLDFSERINAMKELLGLTDEFSSEDDAAVEGKINDKILLWDDLYGRIEKKNALLKKSFKALDDSFAKSIDMDLEKLSLEAAMEDARFQLHAETNKKIAADDQKAFDEWKSKVDQQAAMLNSLASTIGASIGEAIGSGEEGFKQFFQNSLLATIEFLGKLAKMKIAQITIEALATPESVATFGIAGFAKIALLTIGIEAALAKAKKSLGSGDYYTGGPTGPGSKHEPAGVVHKNEYVIPQEGYLNPQLRPFITMIENARLAGSLRYLNPSRVISTGFAEGGPTTQVIQQTNPINPEIANLLRANIQWMQKLYNNGVYANIGYKDVRDIRDHIDTINTIEKGITK